MKISGWGRFPVIESELVRYESEKSLKKELKPGNNLIAFGNGRSYGDSALSKKMVDMKPAQRFLKFDEKTGLLTCQPGVMLEDIINKFLPLGWFPGVVPGTQQITVGGALAADIHGKNHHQKGCFSKTVKEFKLMLTDGILKTCSPTQNREFFLATCGGMGLTGIIIELTIELQKVNSSFIRQNIFVTNNLHETVTLFEELQDEPYSVAWTDCLSNGRSVIMSGDFCNDGNLKPLARKGFSLPSKMPGLPLNRFTQNIFNAFYYKKGKITTGEQKVQVDEFFFPLDSIRNWNLVYGKNGFTQYQFIVPESAGYDTIKEIITMIRNSNFTPTLSVLKLYGPQNENYLSFPFEGYSLAIDFKKVPGLFGFLNRLDEVVVNAGGRLYLAKDVRMSREVFDSGYPLSNEFRNFRKKHNLDTVFQSLQSRRLGI